MEHEQISKAFEQLVKNSKELLVVSFDDGRRAEKEQPNNPYKYQGRIVLKLTPNDTPEKIAELIVKTEEAIDHLEKERFMVRQHEKSHPNLYQRLDNINRIEGYNSCS